MLGLTSYEIESKLQSHEKRVVGQSSPTIAVNNIARQRFHLFASGSEPEIL